MKNSGAESITFEKLDKILAAAGEQEFNYNTFTAAFSEDPRLKTIITNFDQEKIRFNQDEVTVGDVAKTDGVEKMAKRATDVGANL
tara:strand:+ start:4122 stop:4379 length:258 start_codon:yes stop_codon:yes gene_type:complete